MAENEVELNSLLVRVKVESEKVCLKVNIQKTKIMASGAMTSWENGWGNWKQYQTSFLEAPKSLQMVTAVMKLRCLLPGRKDITLPTKGPSSQSDGFSSSHVWM